MRNGGPFPFLAAADEVSMHVELHMRRCGAAKAPPAEEAAARQQQAARAESASWEQSDRSRQRDATFTLPSHETLGGSRSKFVDRPHGLLTCSTHSSIGNYRSWDSGSSQEYSSQAGLGPEHPPRPPSPWYPEDGPLVGGQQQPWCPKTLSEPLPHTEGQGAWERTAGSYGSSQSSSESCHSNGNTQRPVSTQPYLHCSSNQGSRGGSFVGEYPY